MHAEVKIIPIPAFEDNYIWLLRNHTQAVVVDPGDASLVINVLESMQLNLTHVFVTHHHEDHIGGVATLIAKYPQLQVFASKNETYAFQHTAVSESDEIVLTDFIDQGAPLKFKVLDCPGHTSGHIAYYADGILFCGDTLFSAGCGRLFEGTYTQLYDSLQKFARLPKDTLVYCTHEYTIKNLKFALSVEPQNADLQDRYAEVIALRQQQKPSLPSSIKIELNTNPFLRCEILNNSGVTFNDSAVPSTINTFRSLRLKRNAF